MNWSGLAIAIGLLGLAFSTIPYGLAILAASSAAAACAAFGLRQV